MKSSALRSHDPCHIEASGDSIMSDQIETRLARIESDVEYIKKDTTELRVELRRTNDRIDVTNQKIDDLRDSLTVKIEAVRSELTGKFDSLKDSLHSVIVWALLLYFTLAGALLAVIAKAFKWI
jgi:septal ring factor EnvC (AmiA/AmiB activator)